MKPSVHLHQLVRSMTANEKRYFRLNATQHGGNQKYLLLFDAVDQQQEYDETALKEEFHGEKFVRQFGVAKSYLYDLVLKSLRAYQAGSTTTLQLRDTLSNVEILNDKGLFDQAFKILRKGIVLAEKHDRFLFLIEASLWEVVLRRELRTSREDWNRYLLGQKSAVRKLQNYLEYRELMGEVNFLIADDYARTAEKFEAFGALRNHPILTSPEAAESVRAKIYYYWILATGHYARNEFDLALVAAEEMVTLLEVKPGYREEAHTLYLYALGNTLALKRRCGDSVGFLQTINKLEEYRDELERGRHLRSPRIAADLFQTANLYLLAYRISRAEFAACHEMIPEIEAGIERYGEYLKPNILHKFYGNLSYVCFSLGDLNEAVVYNNRILNDRLPNEGKQTYYSTHIVSLILHYELGHIQLVEHRLASTERYLQTEDALGRLEASIISGVRRLVHATDRTEEKEILVDFRNELLLLEEDPLEQNGFRYFGYRQWVESRLYGRPFLDVVVEAYREAEMAEVG